MKTLTNEKGGNKSYNEKNLIKVLKKNFQDKKKLEKEMDDKISSLYKNRLQRTN